MSINNINIENFTVSSDYGIEISEAKNIHLKNINVMAKKPGPLVNMLNSSNINFHSFNSGKEAEIKVAGDRTANILWQNSATINASTSVFEFGSTQNVIQVK